MKDGCLTPEEIGLALATGRQDARRRHLEECAACQALAASLDLFLRDGGLPAGADVADAEDRLQDFLRREVAGGEKTTATGVPARQAATGPWGFRRRGPLVWAAAALLVVAVGLPVVLDRSDDPEPGMVLRGEAGPGRRSLVLAVPVATIDGGVRLDWSAAMGATAYEVIILDGEQGEVARIDGGTSQTRTVDRATLRLLAGKPKPWFVRVVALKDGDLLAESLPRILPEE